MTKFMLGIAVGYVFSEIIDDLVTKASSVIDRDPKASDADEPSVVKEEIHIT